ncbi:MAG: hypothetical protein ACREN8_03315 [Candidatus Dormibacteraceae bacterium]
MEKVKLSLNLDADLATAAKAVAEHRREELSAVIGHALSEYLEHESLRAKGLAAMAEYEAEYGAFTPEEISAAAKRVDSLLGVNRQDRRTA